MTQNNESVSDFRLVGLSQHKTFTLEHHFNQETFKASSEMTQDRFDALFKYCENNWADNKIATVKYYGVNNNGIPINPLVLSIRE